MISKTETKQLQGVAILAMLCLHLFCTRTPAFTPLLYIGDLPLTYFIGQAGDCCVMIYCFCSGYGLMASYLSLGGNGKEYLTGRKNGVFRLLKSYWTILMLFAMVSLLLGKSDEWLGSPIVFLKNFLVFGSSYNGAWWFVGVYLLMVLFSPLILKAVQRHPMIAALAAVLVYIGSYFLRFRYEGFWIQKVSLLGMSYAELLVGAYFCKYDIMTRIEKGYSRILPKKLRVVILTMVVAAVIFVRGYIPTLFVAPISGLIFIVCYLLAVRQGVPLQKGFSFLGKHSINIWLIHMFFYMPMYGGLAYYGKYPVFVLAILLGMCVMVSAGIFGLQSKLKF